MKINLDFYEAVMPGHLFDTVIIGQWGQTEAPLLARTLELVDNTTIGVNDDKTKLFYKRV